VGADGELCRATGGEEALEELAENLASHGTIVSIVVVVVVVVVVANIGVSVVVAGIVVVGVCHHRHLLVVCAICRFSL
jgi:hypothetical protein